MKTVRKWAEVPLPGSALNAALHPCPRPLPHFLVPRAALRTWLLLTVSNLCPFLSDLI